MLTPDQARDLVDHFGGVRAAGRGIGVDNTTVLYWLDPERKRAKERDRYHANPEPRLERQRARYEALTGLEYNRLLLRQRRIKALARRAKRSTQTRGT